MNVERRSVELVDAEMKGRLFRGYAAVFDTPWSDRLTEATGYVEKVARGVFRKALSRSNNVPLLLEHDPHQLLATTQSGNLRIKEDGKGLLTEAKLPDNALAEYARSLIDAGDMRGMSYGVTLDPRRDTMLVKEGNVFVRRITGVQELLDVSLTWQPAYTATSVELRSTGFVATPLQELLGGTEPQAETAAMEEAPDEDAEAWWGEQPAEADTSTEQEQVPYWERLARQIEREY